MKEKPEEKGENSGKHKESKRIKKKKREKREGRKSEHCKQTFLSLFLSLALTFAPHKKRGNVMLFFLQEPQQQQLGCTTRLLWCNARNIMRKHLFRSEFLFWRFKNDRQLLNSLNCLNAYVSRF